MKIFTIFLCMLLTATSALAMPEINIEEHMLAGEEARELEKKYTSSYESNFTPAADLERYESFVKGLHCAFCDSSVLVNGTSPLARDLKRHVLSLIKQSKTDDEIGKHITELYQRTLVYGGDHLSPTDTYGPIVVAFLALLVGVIITLKKRKSRQA